MKKLILLIAIIVAPTLSFGQSIFDQFEDMDGVTSVVVNQRMFKMIASLGIETDNPEEQEIINMIEGLNSLKVLTTEDGAISTKMKAQVSKYLKSSNLDELMRIKDGDQLVKFYVREGKDENHVKELLMFVTGLKEVTGGQNIEINGKKREIETVLLTLNGDIDLRKVSKLTNKMNVKSGKHLEKIEKKN